jgi:transposase
MANESKIMNTTIVSAEAKARLTEAVKSYTPPAPEKYRALNEVKESIMALRERKASYETIRAMLHENAGIEVSHQTVARYCREVLDAAKPKKSRRPKTPPTEPAAVAQEELPARSPVGQPRPREPRVTPSKTFSAAAQVLPVAATESDSKANRQS